MQAGQEPRHLQVQGLSNIQELGTQWVGASEQTPTQLQSPLAMGGEFLPPQGVTAQLGVGGL